jgi:hypothetical protein
MPKKDRTGISYEAMIESSLLFLGYSRDCSEQKNYIRPSSRQSPVIPGTYIQPDFVVRDGINLKSILYVTHWSSRRNSGLKFWRTWEEAAQQKITVEDDILTVNCIFEAFDSQFQPNVYRESNDLPRDSDSNFPVKLNGWDAGIAWSMVEAFDVSIIFPVNYEPHLKGMGIDLMQHDSTTSNLLSEALSSPVKSYFSTQWSTLHVIQKEGAKKFDTLRETHSRYRIGLLHLYISLRVFQARHSQIHLDLSGFLSCLVERSKGTWELNSQAAHDILNEISIDDFQETFKVLSKIYVKKGKKPETLCEINIAKSIVQPEGVFRIKFNKELQLCLGDLEKNIEDIAFLRFIETSFKEFDSLHCIDEVFEDLAMPELVAAKITFAMEKFSTHLESKEKLKALILKYAMKSDLEKEVISEHQQNWVFELVMFLAHLEVEDIYSKLPQVFEAEGHKLRPHAPFGDENKLVGYLIQGKDICEHWKNSNKTRTLKRDDFELLIWESISKIISDQFLEKGSNSRKQGDLIKRYLESKSMRIISSDLNGLYIIIGHFLGDLCDFSFSNLEGFNDLICVSWQTEVISTLWSGRPLETWMTGISQNKKWLIKAVSSQNGHEADKTKELAGRCRALRLAWKHGEDPYDRNQWSFNARFLPKLALILDGDWDINKKRNLYEAGWDWVGDVSQLGELRQLIQESSET